MFIFVVSLGLVYIEISTQDIRRTAALQATLTCLFMCLLRTHENGRKIFKYLHLIIRSLCEPRAAAAASRRRATAPYT